jgi:hypothetical protein
MLAVTAPGGEGEAMARQNCALERQLSKIAKAYSQPTADFQIS